MKKFLYIISFLLVYNQLMAQFPEDALRMSWNIPSGTARNQAIGGAMGSLGGEISSIFVNPAGLGMFKTGEVVLTPGFSFLKGKSKFRGTDASTDQLNKFNFGTSGIVWGFSQRNSRWSSKAFSIAVNRTANFNNTVYYKGNNDYSSFAEPLANEFFNFYVDQKNSNPNIPNDGIITNALNSSDISLLTKMGLYTYLVDIDTSNGQNTVFSRSELAGLVDQENRIITSGGITEIAFGFAANMDDKLYLGGSLGVPIVNYKRTTSFKESDANGTGNNEFTSTSYEETFKSTGLGINAKLGLIFKPAADIRLGFSVHTPTLYGLKDNLTASMTTDIDTATGAVKIFNVKTADLYGGTDPEFRYDLRSPWKFIISGSYLFSEAEDITRQRGFITADIEYSGYGGSRFSTADEGVSNDIYKSINTAVKDIYKGAFNFRVGGELKFKTIMGRAGFAWYGKPYQDGNLKARKMNISGGLGYRNRGMFVDLTYVQSLNKDVNFPYRVDAPRENTYASLKESNGNVLLTLGFKF